MSPYEAIWQLFEFSIYQEFPPIQYLAVHLKGKQTVYFSDNISPMALAIKTANARSILIVFFKYNTIYKDGRRYLYFEFPAEFI
jgi:hypothetical protein